jgi:2-iminobutanoate/2-iminopropanoate deaminase
MKKKVLNKGLQPSAPYSSGIRIGNLLFVSGQVARNEKGEIVGEGDISKQTDQVITNIENVLAEGGGSLKDVAKTTVFLSDIRLFDEMNAVYKKRFFDPMPARSTVQATLANQKFLVEIEAIAVCDS